MKTTILTASALLLASSIAFANYPASTYESIQHEVWINDATTEGEAFEQIVSLLSTASDELAVSVVRGNLEISTNDALTFLEWISLAKQEANYEWDSRVSETVCHYRGKLEPGSKGLMESIRGLVEVLPMGNSGNKADLYSKILHESESDLGSIVHKRLSSWVSRQLRLVSEQRTDADEDIQSTTIVADTDDRSANKEAMVVELSKAENTNEILESACSGLALRIASYPTDQFNNHQRVFEVE